MRRLGPKKEIKDKALLEKLEAFSRTLKNAEKLGKSVARCQDWRAKYKETYLELEGASCPSWALDRFKSSFFCERIKMEKDECRKALFDQLAKEMTEGDLR